MDGRAETANDEQVAPGLTQVIQRQTKRRTDHLAPESGFEHEELDPALQTEPTERIAGDRRDR